MPAPIVPKDRLKFVVAGAMLGVLVAFVLAWLVVVPFYGARHSPALVVLAPFLIAFVAMVSLVDRSVKAVYLALSFGLSLVLGSLSLVFTPPVADSILVSSAISKVIASEESLGRSSPIREAVSRASVGREQTQAHRELLLDITSAVHNRESVTQHLAMARSLGVDTLFVSQTLMVREQDRQALLDRALELAEQGDLVAAQWLGMVNPTL